MNGDIPASEAPSRTNPGTFLYLDGDYFKLSVYSQSGLFDALNTAMKVLEQAGYLVPGGDFGLRSVDKDGNESMTPRLDV